MKSHHDGLQEPIAKLINDQFLTLILTMTGLEDRYSKINPHPKKTKKLNPQELGRPYIQIVETRDMRPVIG